MSHPACAQCGALLFASDRGICPHCQWTVPTETGPSDTLIMLDEGPDELGDDNDPELAFEPSEEALYQAARSELLAPTAQQRNGLALLGLSLAAFVIFQGENSVKTVAILIGVIFFHELGHWAGMRWFGYNDLKMFFIPFFGGAVSGKKEGAPLWQQSIVLLLGPLPGIVIGCGLLWSNLALRSPLALSIGAWLVGINAFNLLPLVPLDGGRLLNLLVFSRHRVLEAFFLAATSLGLIGLGALLGGTKLLMGIGLVGLLVTPAQYRAARASLALRRRWSELPERVSEAGDPVLRDLFREVRGYARFQAKNAGKLYANTMKSVYERAAVRPVSVAMVFGLLAVYGAGFVLTFAAFVAVWLTLPGRQVLLH
ncbi:MAG: hypothetical protein P4L84_26585 [Isosphaeraceae bacterium]|nr:hypothetical protein [Isosphaeraceae bacterium]